MLSPGLLFISINRWLELIVGWLFLVGVILMVISWITPSIFIFLGMPSLTLAWLKGITPTGDTVKSWGELSGGEKTSLYVYSIVTFFVAIGVILRILNIYK